MPKGHPGTNALRESTQVTKGMQRRSALKPPDQFKIGNKAPERAYRFISRTMLEKSGGFDRRGWMPITAENSKGETLMTPTSSYAAGTDKPVGDLILAWMPKEMVEAKRAELDNINSLKKNVTNLRAEGDAAHIPVDAEMELQRQGVTETY
jgi:hypothetical protein